MNRLRRGAGDGQRGSMAIELVAVVPLLVMVAILCIEGFLAASAAGAAQKAARDGARAESVGRSGVGAVNASLPGWVSDSRVSTGAAASPGCVGICYRVEVEVPLVVPGFSTGLFRVARSAELPR